MKKNIIVIFSIVLIGVIAFYTTQMYFMQYEELYQEDADIIRLEHLVYWTGLIEEYHNKTGSYPFQDQLQTQDSIILVKINTQQQQEYFNPDSKKYRKDLDNNPDEFFQSITVKDFVGELEKNLEKNIQEKYDIQKIPWDSTIWYNYFVTEKWYLMWVPCITCWVTPISTLLLDGITPTVNIASSEMVPDVTKALARKDMLQHSIFQQWIEKRLRKEWYIRELEESYFNDSKK